MVERKLKLNSQVRYTTIKDEGLIVAQDDGVIHVVNEVGALLLPLLNGEFTRSDLVEKITEAFDVSPEEARRDLDAFLKELEEKELLDHE